MRTKIIAGNWKMNKDVHQTEEFINGLKNALTFDVNDVKVILCPPFTTLELAHRLMQGSAMELGAQNMYHEDEGAFTGEISPRMLKSVGCKYAHPRPLRTASVFQ